MIVGSTANQVVSSLVGLECTTVTFLDALTFRAVQTFDITRKTLVIAILIVSLDQSFNIVDNLLQKVEIFLNLSENVNTVLTIGPVLPVLCNFLHLELSDFFKVILPCSKLIWSLSDVSITLRILSKLS